MRLNTIHLSLLLGAVACASGGAAGAPTTAAGAAPASMAGQRPDRNVITADELSSPSMNSLSVYEAIRNLRPNFFSNRGNQANQYAGQNVMVDTESGRVHASIDGHAIVSVDELKSMLLHGVIEIRLLSPAAAMQKFGGAAKEGPVILVRTM